MEFDQVFLSSKSEIIERLDKWKNEKTYYNSKNIAYKFALLIHDSPGTGKTSTARAIASYLGYTFTQIDIEDPSRVISSINSCILKPKTLIFMDEIDRVIEQLNNIQVNSKVGGNQLTISKAGTQLINTLMKLLENPDQEEVVYIFATNKKPDFFDPALFRPGRIELVEEFHFCDTDQFERIFKYYTEEKIPLDFKFEENKYSTAYIINSLCIPYHDNPEKIFEKLNVK